MSSVFLSDRMIIFMTISSSRSKNKCAKQRHFNSLFANHSRPILNHESWIIYSTWGERINLAFFYTTDLKYRLMELNLMVFT